VLPGAARGSAVGVTGVDRGEAEEMLRDGRTVQALAEFERLAGAGDAVAAHNAGVLHLMEDRNQEAERWFRQGAEGGVPASAMALGALLQASGRLEEGTRWIDVVFVGVTSMPAMQTPRGADQARRAASAQEAFDRAKHLFAEGDAQGMRLSLADAAQAGHIEAMLNLGVLEFQDGRIDAAAGWLKRAAEGGSTDAMFNLGSLYNSVNLPGRAEQWWLAGARAGDPESAAHLGALWQAQGHLDLAERWLQAAADVGQVDAILNLGTLMAETGRLAEAVRLWRLGAERGDHRAATNLAILLQRLDQNKPVE
jgi:uncharacterized protein